ncbi:MAG: hypothetical protein EKK52_07835 [Burkholderiales bacterium]|nr:MAG: hypothetical protein EKK52_07835 [Burkholderiales bacterium]
MHCTACWSFCNINLPVSPQGAVLATEQQAAAELDLADVEIMFVNAPQQVLFEIAQVNPDAGVLLSVLVRRSRSVALAPPTKGHGASGHLVSRASANAWIQGASPSPNIQSSAMLPEGHTAAVAWELEKHPGGARLVLSHRLKNGGDGVIAQPYPDIELSLRSVRKQQHGSAWTVVKWAVKQ